ncbi:type II toxin-antitoxin system HigA family antitoxin [Pseudomonas sp. NPDC086581]|uniref:helix-turn-helix domain-containing protein n=1 Tax=Pseudomonas sp. NPDC086581 TaxID=3364432 RepID=UPI00380BE1A2
MDKETEQFHANLLASVNQMKADQAAARTAPVMFIVTEADYRIAMARLDDLWNSDPGTPEGEELMRWVLAIERYEDEHYPIGPLDPIEALRLRLDQQGLPPEEIAAELKKLATASHESPT